MEGQELNTHAHATFSIYFHLVFVTKYRKKVITPDMMTRLEKIFVVLCNKWNCDLTEFNGEPDHVHLLVRAHPNMNLSQFINNIKTVSSRRIRKEFAGHVSKYYWKPVFWKKAYCAISAGGAPLEILKEYIRNQGNKD